MALTPQQIKAQGYTILTDPNQIKDYTIAGQYGVSGQKGSFLYGKPKAGASLNNTLTSPISPTAPTASVTPVAPSPTSLGERQIPQTNGLSNFSEGLKQIDSYFRAKQDSPEQVLQKLGTQLGQIINPDVQTQALSQYESLKGRSAESLFKSAVDLISEQQKNQQNYMKTVLDRVDFVPTAKEYQELLNNAPSEELMAKIQAAETRKQATDNKFQFVPTTENQPGGSFDPKTGKFTQTSPTTPAPSGPITIDSFMSALSGQESGGDYGAKNARTGASGRFQILPSNWPAWSKEAGLTGATQTPENQDKVAKFKLQQYYNKYGNWEDVASAWYSGKPFSQVIKEGWADKKQGAGNEPSVREYVNSVLGKAGFATSTFDQFSNEQIALSVIPTQLRNSDAEKKQLLAGIRKGLADGKTPYEVADIMMGYKINSPSPLSDSLRKFIGLADLAPAQIADVARLINNGNNVEAIAKIENALMMKAKQSDPDGYIGEGTVKTAISRANALQKEVNSLGTNSPIGVVKGTMETWLGRLKGKEAQSVATQIKNLTAEMRNRLSGTAVTASEERFLSDIIPQLGDSPDNFMIKINNLKNQPLLQLNNLRSTFELPALDEKSILDRKNRLPLYGSTESQNTTQLETRTTPDGKRWQKTTGGWQEIK